MVKVNTSNDAEFWVVKRRSAEDSGVGANIGTNPIAGEVIGVGIDGILESLKGNVGFSESFIGESNDEVELVFEVIRKVTILR